MLLSSMCYILLFALLCTIMIIAAIKQCCFIRLAINAFHS